MVNFTSWRFWVIVALALGTLACANRAERRERKEEAREERRVRREAARDAARERAEQRKAERETRGDPAPVSARERREAARQERAERRQAPREQPQAQPAPVQQAAAPAKLTPTSTAVAPPEAPSRVVFMRVSKQSSATNALLFDVTEPGDPKLIGNVQPASKLTYALKPGLYTFMVLGDTAEFMQATIVGGKTYYALVIPRGGATRFSVEPIRQNEIGGKEFAGWDKGTKTTTGATAPYDKAAAAEKRVRHWQEWSKKSETQRAELTLNAEDGR